MEDLDLEKDRDYILVRDGDNPNSLPIARLSGNKEQNQKLVMSTGDKLYVYFKTALGQSRKGFNIKYTQGKFGNTYWDSK